MLHKLTILFQVSVCIFINKAQNFNKMMTNIQ